MAHIKPIVLVLVLASDVPQSHSPGRFEGSLLDAVSAPVSVLARTGDAHEQTYLREISELIPGNSIFELRPPGDSEEVPLGWLLSPATRCEMDQLVNKIVNESDASKAIADALGVGDPPKLTWQSCEASSTTGTSQLRQ